MTPQEQQLVEDLFDRLSKLEDAPRDPEAERLIAVGTRRAPHAIYALVQTVLVQDEALKRANAHVKDLEAQLGGGAQSPQQGGFLDSMRGAVFGGHEARGSVPAVHPQAMASPGPGASPGAAAYQPGPIPYPARPAFGSGGSFLGTAASSAAGVIGGALLLDGIRSMCVPTSAEVIRLHSRASAIEIHPGEATRPTVISRMISASMPLIAEGQVLPRPPTFR